MVDGEIREVWSWSEDWDEAIECISGREIANLPDKTGECDFIPWTIESFMEAVVA